MPSLQWTGRTTLTNIYRDSDADHEWRRRVRFGGDIPHHRAHCYSVDNLDRHGPGSCAGYHPMEHADEETIEASSIRTAIVRLAVSLHFSKQYDQSLTTPAHQSSQ